MWVAYSIDIYLIGSEMYVQCSTNVGSTWLRAENVLDMDWQDFQAVLWLMGRHSIGISGFDDGLYSLPTLLQRISFPRIMLQLVVLYDPSASYVYLDFETFASSLSFTGSRKGPFMRPQIFAVKSFMFHNLHVAKKVICRQNFNWKIELLELPKAPLTCLSYYSPWSYYF